MTTISNGRAYATVTGPTATFTSPDGRTEPLTADGDEDIRHTVLRRATAEARRTGTPIELVTAGDRGDYRLLVGADGTLNTIDTSAPPTPVPEAALIPEIENSQGEGVREQAPQPSTPILRDDSTAEPPTRPTFLTPPAEVPIRAAGWRGALARVGIRIPPSAAEQRRGEWVATVSRQWAGCRTMAIANGKGGVGKTMTTAMLSAVYARNGGGNVLAWDNNDTRGTLGWRTEQGLYDTTLRDLLPAAHDLLTPTAGISEIARYVHHQGTDRYDVLRSNPELLATDQRIATAEFDLLMQVAARYYRLVVFDSGNDESAERWLRMIDSAYQLVIPTLPSPESAESAALLLDELRRRDEHSAALADHAVVIVTQHEPGNLAAARRVAEGFAGHVRAVQIIPFDPALKSGPLRLDALRRPTRDAWLKAAASAVEGL